MARNRRLTERGCASEEQQEVPPARRLPPPRVGLRTSTSSKSSGELRASGALTDEEFDAEKAEDLLGS